MHENKKIWVNNYNLLAVPDLSDRQITCDVLRIDTLHEVVSGNKWFKLKGWLQYAREHQYQRLLTFGGAWSNHIAAAAYAAMQANIPSIGIIRGEKPAAPSQTLLDAQSYGMHLEFVSREQYRQWSNAGNFDQHPQNQPHPQNRPDPDLHPQNQPYLSQLREKYPQTCIIPEGGAGLPGIQGSEEILRVTDTGSYTHILCAYGTGTMYQGLLNAAQPHQTVLAISVLKGSPPSPIPEKPAPFAASAAPSKSSAKSAATTSPAPSSAKSGQIITGYHFGGYARHTPELLAFMNEFYTISGIPTDFVYTGKLAWAALDMIRKDFFPPGSRLLLIHSGGLQGNRSLHQGVLYF